MSDHALVVLKTKHVYYCLTPFKVFQSWFLIDGFDQTALDAWSRNDEILNTSKFIVFKNKLEPLKR